MLFYIFFNVVGTILFTIFIYKIIYLNMEKQLINEAKRLQELAGINEVKIQTKEDILKQEVMDVLRRNGIDEDYFESMGGKEIEGGSEEWLDVVSDITGKDAYQGNFDDEDDEKIRDFMEKLDELGIEFF
jgi:hypothetical protein